MQPIAIGIKEAASIIGVSRAKMYQLLGSGALPARKVGNRTLILKSDLQNFIESAPPYSPLTDKRGTDDGR